MKKEFSCELGENECFSNGPKEIASIFSVVDLVTTWDLNLFPIIKR